MSTQAVLSESPVPEAVQPVTTAQVFATGAPAPDAGPLETAAAAPAAPATIGGTMAAEQAAYREGWDDKGIDPNTGLAEANPTRVAMLDNAPNATSEYVDAWADNAQLAPPVRTWNDAASEYAQAWQDGAPTVAEGVPTGQTLPTPAPAPAPAIAPAPAAAPAAQESLEPGGGEGGEGY